MAQTHPHPQKANEPGGKVDARDARIVVDSNDQTRRRNLAAIVTLIHRDGATARASLTRATGLNRATIGTLVAELEQAGIVTENSGVSLGAVGRPSTVVEPSEALGVLAVNPETAAVSFALVGFGRGILATWRVPMDMAPRPEQTVALTIQALADLPEAGMRVLGIGAAVPGVIRVDDGHVRTAPHLGWSDVPFGGMLAEATGLPVTVGNDATFGALGEASFGQGRGIREMVYLNGVSGIGGGIITGGALMAGDTGAAGEFGHMVIDMAGEQCHCGRCGCLETVVSMSKLAAVSSLDLVVDDLDDYLGTDLPESVTTELDRQINALVVGLINVCNAIDPRLIVLGGYLGCLYGYAGERIREGVRSGVIAADSRGVSVARATRTPPMVLVGAAERSLQRFLDDPIAAVG